MMIVLFYVLFLHADIIGPSKAITGETVIFHCVGTVKKVRYKLFFHGAYTIVIRCVLSSRSLYVIYKLVYSCYTQCTFTGMY